jgi:hypothetical protein
VQTLKLHIKSISDSEFIKNKQQNYSYAIRKLYKHIDKIGDKSFLEFISNEFDLNDIELRSAVSEAKSKFERAMVNKVQEEEMIVDLHEELKKLKDEEKNKKIIRQQFKSYNNLKKKDRNLSKDIVFGTKEILQRLSFLSNDKKENKEEIAETRAEFTANRLYPFHLIGEANQNGNRFFNFDLTNRKVVYKPNRKEKIFVEFSNYSSYKNILLKLQHLIDEKEIPVSVMMDSEYINLTFDDELLHGYAVDEKERKKAVEKIKSEHIDKEIQAKLIKAVYVDFYNEQREKKMFGKLSYRYLSVDLNPYYIGCSIMDYIDGDIKIVSSFYYDLSTAGRKLFRTASDEHRKYINYKRIHGINHIWKDLFETFAYYKCGHLVVETLDFKNKPLETKEANRQTRYIWHRALTTALINKHCNKNGINKIEITPCYSSLIGNTMYNFFTDPVNASIEIGRRGIGKYIKDKFYPKIDAGTITDTMTRLNPSGDVLYLKDCQSWTDINNQIKESGLRYRAALDDNKKPNKVVLNLIHSNIKKIVFSSENFVSLHIKL